MDKNAVKKYAVWARNELIARVSQKALQYGITKNNIVDAVADSVGGKLLTDAEKKQRQALIAQIKEKGFEQVIEEVAYTWFNRFSALRFMEVNGYLPSHVRVFTDEENNFKPQIITEAIHLEIDGLDMEKVYAFKEADKTEELYKYLLITQCNALNKILPGMFQRISDYTELLLPDNLLREGSVIEQMISMIPEEDWKDAVQIIGWLYQYYNSEPKDKVFENLKKNIKITKENIPAATQLFTPDWIVRYMVENSLGRLWLEGHPNDELKSNWKYYLDEAEQEADVKEQLDAIRKEYKNIKPEEIKCIDPCMGSGHILVYMFDVLVQIYEAYGYTTREAAASIVENNIWGLDIDERAAQLSNFAIMMKARQYDRRFSSRDIQPHVYAICESNHIDRLSLEYFINGNAKLKNAINTIIEELHDAKEYGSILNVTNVDFDALYVRFDEIKDDISMYKDTALKDLLPLVQVAQTIAQKYDVVVTNPPYMGSSGMSGKLSEYVKKYFSDSKSDFFSIFIERCESYTKKNGFYSMITQPSFLFLSSFEKLRNKILSDNTIFNLLHLGRGIFGIDFGSTAFVIRKNCINSYNGCYFRLHERTFQYVDPDDIAKLYLLAKKDHSYKFDFSEYDTKNGINECTVTSTKALGLYYEAKQRDFEKIPGLPIAYWASKGIISAFENGTPLGKLTVARNGMKTGDNNRFLRLWWEIQINEFEASAQSVDEAIASVKKWFPYNKGGETRKWYGNNDYVVNWENGGAEIFNNAKRDGRNVQDYPDDMKFKPAGTWSLISSGKPTFRYKECNLSDIAGMSFYQGDSKTKYYLGFCNTPIAAMILQLLAPTINYQSGDIGRLPIFYVDEKANEVTALVDENIRISKKEWDSFETSWNYIRNPLIEKKGLLGNIFDSWQSICDDRIETVKSNEEKLNQIFLDIYGLQNEFNSEIMEEDITLHYAELQQDVKGLISYTVGCMFGRYSLDVDGLVYAGGDWDASKYRTFPADRDNIIPICDDEYFEDDMAGRFIKFVETVYGKETLAENLKFIADALGGKGNPKDVIRNYFISDFYNDHVKMYQKRPIYWQFDSGKKNGFKALIYMHRYREDTIARIRTDYVHEQQSRYRTAIADLEQRINGASTSDRVKLNKQLTKLKEQDTELRSYEEKIHHLADQMIRIDLDDGVKNNYDIFKDVLAKIK